MHNFFKHQRQARRKTWLLVTLFVLAVTLLIALAHWPILWLMRVLDSDLYILFNYGLQPLGEGSRIHLGVTFTIGTIIMSAVLYKYLQLRRGGHVIAQQLGGEQVQSNCYDPLHRLLLNVVEEVAIAARMPVPGVYVLKNQPSINAFAAGYHRQDSVIAVTQGALRLLSREQLQAVVAHEFSHIRHGDVRLNVRMTALLFGITFIGQAGENLIHGAMYASRGQNQRGDGAGLPAIVGLILTLFGWLGTQLGDAIKALVCRQREYLADAGAAELTRAPYDLAQALLVIAESPRKNTLRQSNAHLYSHLFFSDALSPWLSWLSTHPPLSKRIRALDPSWDGMLTERPRGHAHATVHGAMMAAHEQSLLQVARHQRNSENQIKLEGIDANLGYLAHEPVDAQWLVMMLCLHQDWQQRQTQLRQIVALPYVDAFKFDQAEASLAGLGMSKKLMLLEVAIGALRCLPLHGQREFLAKLKNIVVVDGNLDLHAWSFYELSVHALSGANSGTIGQFNRKIIAKACEQLLNALASFGHSDEQQQATALNAASEALQLPMRYYGDAQCQVTRLQRALSIVKTLPQAKKQVLIQACQLCISHDGEINEAEQVILYTLAACLNVDSEVVSRLPG
ncbi:M48 family metalloprotease [Pseudoalteromonas sp. BDTF-M6]|uniref:M48 family metalloprotease n=1 Tax=Pseudoalteromonas sp. BDTF-M6 TaxID=2796132 RepID=UPI001BB054CC|nr:M48 family metalloprotease [Pseudoalteromonas sp. BDTF-M6]